MRRERIEAPKARRRRNDDLDQLHDLEATAPTVSRRSRRLARELAALLAQIDALLENPKEVCKMQTLKRLALLVSPAALFLAVFAGMKWP